MGLDTKNARIYLWGSFVNNVLMFAKFINVFNILTKISVTKIRH